MLRFCTTVAHKIYGVPQTINSANYVYFLAYKELFALRDDGPNSADQAEQLDRLVTGELLVRDLRRVLEHISSLDELLNLHRGQGLDLLWRDTLTCPTEEEYVQMVNNSPPFRFNTVSVR